MTDEPYAAQLRARAAEARAGWSRETRPSAQKDRIRGRTFRQLNESDEGAVVLSVGEVEAIADALEAAQEVCDSGGDDAVFEARGELRAALEALNRRGASQ
jgi:hypothetical protein